MGLIHGVYDAKAEGFVPGGGQPAQLHDRPRPRRGDLRQRASRADLKPQYLADTLAFMFETRWVIRPTRFALETPRCSTTTWRCWQGLGKNFPRP